MQNLFAKCGESRFTPVLFELAFPDCNHVPAVRFKPGGNCGIPTLVAFNLACPEADACLWKDKQTASPVAVPEAAVDKDYGPVASQYDIGASR